VILRRLKLSGDYSDADWTNPANAPPDNARPFKATRDKIVFELIARTGTGDDADEVDIGALQVDAWVGFEGELREPGNPAAGRTIRRGLTVVEATNSTIPGRVRLLASDAEVGGVGRLNLALTGVAIPALHVKIISGARPL